jgi:hypothetical protein
VDGIVSIDQYDVVVTGVANHAGTTPMPDRQDALLAAARLTLAVRETVTGEAGAQVGTVGHLEVSPNASNVIPGEVKMSVEMRDLSSAKLDRLGEKLQARAAAIAVESRNQIRMTRILREESAVAAVEVQRAIRSGCGPAAAQYAASAKRRGARCADDGEAHADGHDFRAEHRGNQSFAEGAHNLAGLREWGQRSAGDGAKPGELNPPFFTAGCRPARRRRVSEPS